MTAKRWNLDETLFAVLQFSVLLLVGWHTVVSSPEAVATKAETLSLLGLLTDATWLIHSPLLPIFRVTTLALLFAWLTIRHDRARQVIFVATPLAFIATMSCVVETHYFTQHQTHFVAVIFLVLGFVRYRDARFGVTTRRLPVGAFLLLLYYICISYTYSGLTKVSHSGWDWGNGSSLTMWTEQMGSAKGGIGGLLTTIITVDQRIAWVVQNVTFVAELAAVLCLFIPRLRPVLGLCLVGFHASVELIFQYGFMGNIAMDSIVLVAYYASPTYRIGIQNLFNSPVDLNLKDHPQKSHLSLKAVGRKPSDFPAPDDLRRHPNC